MEFVTHNLTDPAGAIGPAGLEPVMLQEEDVAAYLRALAGIMEAEEVTLSLHPQLESEIPVGIICARETLSVEARASIALLPPPRMLGVQGWTQADEELGWVECMLDGRPWQALRIAVPSRRARTIVTLSFLFRSKSDEERAPKLAQLKLWEPTIHAYLRLWQRMRAKMRGAEGLRAALDSVETAVLILNKGGRLIFTNKAAAELIAAGEPVRRVGDSLAATDLRQAVSLQVAISHAIAGNGEVARDRTSRKAPMLALRSGKFGRNYVLCVVPAEERAMEEQDAAAILFIVDPKAEPSRHLATVAGLFGLSPVENRLACLLTVGKTLQEAAEAMRIKDQTARSYLKQIFLKTDTKRQAELVRLMLTSHLRIEHSIEAASMQESGLG